MHLLLFSVLLASGVSQRPLPRAKGSEGGWGQEDVEVEFSRLGVSLQDNTTDGDVTSSPVTAIPLLSTTAPTTRPPDTEAPRSTSAPTTVLTAIPIAVPPSTESPEEANQTTSPDVAVPTATLTLTLTSVLDPEEPRDVSSTSDSIFETWWVVVLLLAALVIACVATCFVCISWGRSGKNRKNEQEPDVSLGQSQSYVDDRHNDFLSASNLPIEGRVEAPLKDIPPVGDGFVMRSLGEAGILSMDLRDVSGRLGNPETVMWVKPVLRDPEHVIAPPTLFHSRIIEGGDDASEGGGGVGSIYRAAGAMGREGSGGEGGGGGGGGVGLNVLRALPSDHTSPSSSPRLTHFVIPRLDLG